MEKFVNDLQQSADSFLVRTLNLEERGVLIKNFVVLNVCTCLIATSFEGIATITQFAVDTFTISVSMACLFFTQLLTCLVLPQVMFDTLGFKYTLLSTVLGYFLFIAANLVWPSLWLLVPTAVLCGLGNGVAFTTIGVYITMISKRLAKITTDTFVSLQTLLFGVFFAMLLGSYIIESFLVASILDSAPNSSSTTLLNNTMNAKCGVDTCPLDKLNFVLGTRAPTTSSVRWLYVTFLLSCAAAAIVGFLFLDDLKFDENNDPVKRLSLKDVTLGDLKSRFNANCLEMKELGKDVDIWLLLPIAAYLGYELTYIWYDFNKAFVACVSNVNFVGWVNLVFGVSGVVCSIGAGLLVKHVGLQASMTLMLMIAFSNCVFMMVWTPSSAQTSYLLWSAVGFGFTEAVATGQVRCLFGLYFPSKPIAYSYAFLYETFGLLLGSALSIFGCTSLKIQVFVLVIFASLVCFSLLEIRRRKSGRELGSTTSIAKATIENSAANQGNGVENLK